MPAYSLKPEDIEAEAKGKEPDDATKALANLTPEEWDALIGSADIPEEQKIIEQEMAKALALRTPHAGQHITGLGALLGGLGDAANTAQGSVIGALAKYGPNGQQALMRRQREADQAAAKARMQAAGMQPPGAQPQAPQSLSMLGQRAPGPVEGETPPMGMPPPQSLSMRYGGQDAHADYLRRLLDNSYGGGGEGDAG